MQGACLAAPYMRLHTRQPIRRRLRPEWVVVQGLRVLLPVLVLTPSSAACPVLRLVVRGRRKARRRQARALVEALHFP